MLRISRMNEGPCDVTLKLEGRIVSEWVPLLKQECLRMLKQKKNVSLDFSGVTFVDDRGIEMLKAMGQRVELMNCSLLVATLLQEEGGS